MKKIKNRSLMLNKMYISKISNAHAIVGGTDVAGTSVAHQETRQEPNDSYAGCAMSSYCTQETQTTGEVTAQQQQNGPVTGTTSN